MGYEGGGGGVQHCYWGKKSCSVGKNILHGKKISLENLQTKGYGDGRLHWVELSELAPTEKDSLNGE